MNVEMGIEKYLSSIRVERNLSERTFNAYSCDLKSFAKFFEGGILEEIYIDDIRNYLKTLEETNQYKDTTIRRKIASLKAFFNFLEDENIIPSSPARKIKRRYEVVKRLPRVMPIRDVKKLLCAAYREKHSIENSGNNRNHQQFVEKLTRCCRNIAMLELLFSTGMRIGELVNLSLDDIDFTTRTVLILGKGRKERVLYLSSDEVILSLRDYLGHRKNTGTSSQAMFVNKFGTRLSIYSVINIFRHYCKTARIRNHFTPHCLRHTMATMLLCNGADMRSVQEILGHASILTTQIYLEVSSAHKKKVLTKFNERNRMKISLLQTNDRMITAPIRMM